MAGLRVAFNGACKTEFYFFFWLLTFIEKKFKTSFQIRLKCRR